MKKILISLMTLVLVVGMVGAGAFAYFSDVETSAGNTFTAGTLDLEIGSPSSTIVSLGDIKPGETGRGVINLRNVGTIKDVYLLLQGGWPLTEPSETEPSDPKLAHNVSANEFASAIHITYMVYEPGVPYGGGDYIDGPDDDVYDGAPGVNGNGISDLYDFCKFYHAPQGAVTVWRGDGEFIIEWEFMPYPANYLGETTGTQWYHKQRVDETGVSCDNDFQGDGVEFELIFTLWHGEPPK